MMDSTCSETSVMPLCRRRMQTRPNVVSAPSHSRSVELSVRGPSQSSLKQSVHEPQSIWDRPRLVTAREPRVLGWTKTTAVEAFRPQHRRRPGKKVVSRRWRDVTSLSRPHHGDERLLDYLDYLAGGRSRDVALPSSRHADFPLYNTNMP